LVYTTGIVVLTGLRMLMLRPAKLIIFAALPAALLILVLSYFFIDLPLIYWAASLSPQVAKVANAIVWWFSPYVFMVAWPLIFFFYTFILEKSTFRNELLFIVIAVPAAVLAGDIIKDLVGRSRPELLFQEGIYGFLPLSRAETYRSFPSGHSCAICSVMAALSCFRPKWSWLFFLIALALSFFRVLGLAHYFSDIWGAIIITFCLVYSLYLPYQRKSIWKNISRTKS